MHSFSIPLAGLAKMALPVILFSSLATAQQVLDAETQAKIDARGQNAKYSPRAHVFRFAPDTDQNADIV